MNDTVANPVVEEKKVLFCKKAATGKVLSFTFGDGTVVSLDLAELSDEMQEELMIHGALQKIGDSYSSAGGDYAFGIANAERVVANLRAGEFNAGRTAGGAQKPSGELVTALATLQNKSVEEVTSALENATDDQKKAIRAHPAVKAKIAELRAAKAADALAKAGDTGILAF
jgi:hypothetical protein